NASRTATGEFKQPSINENRVASSGISKTILKPKALSGRSILSSIEKSSINMKVRGTQLFAINSLRPLFTCLQMLLIDMCPSLRYMDYACHVLCGPHV
ncbi:hypothetical protein FB639_001511, partial [Coemansia asiatica]